MPDKRHASLIGPMLLILAGVVLLLNQMGIWRLDWSAIWQFWPVLLILIGIEVLLGRTRLGNMLTLLIGIGLFVALVFFVPVASFENALVRETYSYPLRGVETATVHLGVSVGSIDLCALDDSDQLLTAEVTHDPERARIVERFDLLGDEARVTLKTTGTNKSSVGRSQQEWCVALSPEVPLRLHFDGGASAAELDLAGLTLSRLDVNLGVGDATVSLSEIGAYDVAIDGGVGLLTLNVPTDVEARIRVDGALGSIDVASRFEQRGRYYVTEGYEPEEDHIRVDVDGGIGAIHIR